MGAPGTTPGPWMVEPINDGETYQVTTVGETDFIVICESEWGGTEDERNAHQLAASPALYDALAVICAEFAQGHPLIVAGAAALAMARGEQS